MRRQNKKKKPPQDPIEREIKHYAALIRKYQRALERKEQEHEEATRGILRSLERARLLHLTLVKQKNE